MLPGAEMALRMNAQQQLEEFRAGCAAGRIVLRDTTLDSRDNTLSPDYNAEDPFFPSRNRATTVLHFADVQRPDLGDGVAV